MQQLTGYNQVIHNNTQDYFDWEGGLLIVIDFLTDIS